MLINNLNYVSNPFNNPFNNNNINIGEFGEMQIKNFKTEFNIPQNKSYNLISIGLNINPLQSEIIIDSCMESYMQNKGNINNQIIKSLSNRFKNYFSSEYLIITFNEEYKELYFNSSLDLKNSSIIFYLYNTKFHIISLC